MTLPIGQTPDGAVAAAPACTLVIFGANGDLTKRLLIPALYDLAGAHLLDDRLRVLGIDHNPRSGDDWRAGLAATMQTFTQDPSAEFYTERVDEHAWSWVAQRLSYMTADFLDAASYRALAERLDRLSNEVGNGNVIFYLAVAAHFFAPIAAALGEAGLLAEGKDRFRRLVVEKPFGEDLPSSQSLNRQLLAVAAEQQIYRIDHFLGKDTVQNILALRFAGRLLEPIWSGAHIDYVEITASETIGVEDRGAFYDATGALRDMVPNHLFQILSLVTMERPERFEAEAVRDARTRALAAVRPIDPADAVRGQYGAGTRNGERLVSYREEKRVPPDSRTETYVALKLMLDSPRWQGTSFYLRTGKHLSARRTEIALHLKPSQLFDAAPESMLLLEIDPQQGVRIVFPAKQPGPSMKLHPVAASFSYGDFFEILPSVGYETLLYDCMWGDPMLFQRADMIEAAWRAVQPLLDRWADDHTPPEIYPSGSEGPRHAADLLARDGRKWRKLED